VVRSRSETFCKFAQGCGRRHPLSPLSLRISGKNTSRQTREASRYGRSIDNSANLRNYLARYRLEHRAEFPIRSLPASRDPSLLGVCRMRRAGAILPDVVRTQQGLGLGDQTTIPGLTSDYPTPCGGQVQNRSLDNCSASAELFKRVGDRGLALAAG
jgi:hypothetical protein